MQIFDFLNLSVMIAPHNVLAPYVNSNWIDPQKSSQGQREVPLRGGGSSTPPLKVLIFICIY